MPAKDLTGQRAAVRPGAVSSVLANRGGMRALLESEPRIEVAGEAADGREALKLCFSLDPDIAIIDIGMPRLNGIDVTAQAVKQSPKLKVIILSMYADESYVLRALMAGAKGYLLKEATEDDLIAEEKE